MREALIREIQELRLLVGSPRDPDGRVFAQLGDALRRSGELREALAVLREGVGRHPRFTPGHLALAWAAQESGRLDEALEGYRTLLALDPENPFGLFGAGSLLQAKGDPSGSPMLDRARELHPGIQDQVPDFSQAAPSLPGLPFVSLSDLAPAGEAAAAELDGLPFMALAQLAPDAPAGARSGGPADDEGLPFVPLSHLAPEGAGQDLPFLSLTDLAPGADAEGRPSPAEVAPAGAEGDQEDEEGPGDATPVTRTMAELFVRQGLMDRAVQLYEQLVEQHPDDVSVVERLLELRTGEGWIGEEEREESGVEVPGGEAEGEGETHHPALSIPEPEPLTPSPYGWSGEGDEVAEPRPERRSTHAYFGRLLAWTPGNPAREADEAASPEPPAGTPPEDV